MTQQIINLGIADKGNGDVLRTAFTKVNDNFAELYNSVSAVVVVSATAPTAPSVGDLWWNSTSGRMYVYYGTAWVDASPVDGAGISSTNELVNGSKTVSLGTDGYITLAHGAKLYDYGSGTGNGYGITDAVNGTYIGYDPADTLGALHMDSYNGKNIRIRTTTLPSTYKDWLFGANGSLTFPDSAVQTTAWTGSVSSLVNGAHQLELVVSGATPYVTFPAVAGGSIIIQGSEISVDGSGAASLATLSSAESDVRLSANATGAGAARKDWTFGTDGSLTLPGAVVKSTVAKTGATIPTTTGPINNFDFSPLDGSGGLVDGTNIGPLTVGTMIFFAGVENGLPFGSYIQTQPILTIGDTIGTIDSGDLGGTPGTTFTLTVTNVVQETPTAIDLTKSVNKLTNGSYTLANGVEGQIIYLVRQAGSTAHNVTVANVRLDGTTYTDVPFTPFIEPGPVTTNMATLIFTDGAWQSMGGDWD